jgi:carbon storage regulator
MLVLTRKVGEKIIISDNIVVTVLDVRDGVIKLGFTAPKNIVINREEIHRKIHGMFPGDIIIAEENV